MTPKTICYFGCYEHNYARNKVLIKGLQKNGCAIKECHTSEMRGIKKYLDLYKKFKSVGDFDALIIAHPGHDLVWFAKLLTRKPVIFDPIYSYYDSYVNDRKLCQEGSLKSYYYKFWDWFCSWLPDIVILECDTLIDYFVENFKLPREKFIKVVMSADDESIYPRSAEMDTNKFTVHFHGSFIPFQGIEHIVHAAKLLEDYSDIQFNIIGAGQTSKKIEELMKNLNVRNINYWGKRIPHEEVVEHISRADVCLGFFGNGPRAQKVMTNKVFESIAMKKPVITADLPVMREIYTDQEILFCEGENPQDLAAKVLVMRNNLELRNQTAENSYRLFKEKLCPVIVTREIIKCLE
ncbi:MAG: glycosyltransferase [Parcubacteria group bacterium]|nr:glycosyltransferase [Parcubacteria group bacterium]